MDRSSESPAQKSPTAKLEVNPHDMVPREVEEVVRVVTEHDYTSPEPDNESSCQPDSLLCDASGTSQDHHFEESGRRILKAVRRTQSGGSARRDSSSSWSTCSSSSSSSTSMSTSSGTSSGSGGDGSSSGSSSSGDGGSSGSSGTTTGTTSSSCSLYDRTYIPTKDVVFASNTTDSNTLVFGGNTESEAFIPAEAQSDDLPSRAQQTDTSVPLDEKATVVNEEPFYKVTRLSESSSSSTSSERSKSGLTTAVQDLSNNNFIESADISKAYERAKDPREEEQRENNTWDVVSKCMEAVATRVSHFRSLAQSLLGEDYTPRDSFRKSDTSGGDVDGSKCSEYEIRLEAIESYLLDAYTDLVSEENTEEEVSSPTSSIGCSKEFIKETIKRDAELFSQESSSSDECEETTNSGPGNQAFEDESNNNVKDEGQRYSKKEVMEVCKSADKSLKRVLRKKEILKEISKTAEQYVKETKLTYSIILTIMNCTINVARPALEAHRFLQTALRKVSTVGFAKTDLVKSVTILSTLAHQILSYVDEMEEYRVEAVGTLSDAEMSLEEVQMDESIGDDIVIESSCIKDHIHMLADEVSDVSLETLKDRSDDVKFRAGSVEYVVRSGQNDSAGMKDLYKKCNGLWLQLLASLVTVTSISVKALHAATNALEELSKPNWS